MRETHGSETPRVGTIESPPISSVGVGLNQLPESADVLTIQPQTIALILWFPVHCPLLDETNEKLFRSDCRRQPPAVA